MKKHHAALVFLLLLITNAQLSGSDLSLVAGIAPTSDLELDLDSVDLQSFSAIGVRFEKDILFFLGFENSLIYTNNLLTPSGEPGENGLYYSANLVVNLGYSEVIVPNLTIGLGILHRFGDTFPDVGSTFQTNWGGGVKFKNLAGPMGFRVDYRRFKFYSVEETSVNSQELSGGVIFSF